MEYDFRDRFGRYYEDFEVGDVYKHWPARPSTSTTTICSA